jgi:hypothetical protein
LKEKDQNITFAMIYTKDGWWNLLNTAMVHNGPVSWGEKEEEENK